MVVVEGVARGSIQNSTSGRSLIPWCANGSSATSARSGVFRARCPGAGELARVLADLPAIASRAAGVLERMEKMMAREGVTLVAGDRPHR